MVFTVKNMVDDIKEIDSDIFVYQPVDKNEKDKSEIVIQFKSDKKKEIQAYLDSKNLDYTLGAKSVIIKIRER